MARQTLDGAAHIVQLALTPIFLLTGVAQLLNVFTTRLGRVADRLHHIRGDPHATEADINRLKTRSRVLDAAVLLASTAGVLTCCTALVLFTGAVRNEDAAAALFWLFGAALICAVASLTTAAIEIYLSSRTLRDKADQAVAKIRKGDAPG